MGLFHNEALFIFNLTFLLSFVNNINVPLRWRRLGLFSLKSNSINPVNAGQILILR